MRWLVTVGRGWAPPGRTEHGPGRRKTPHCRRGRRGNARVAPSARERLEHPGPAFVREEIHHVREGKHGARSTKQAFAIRLSEARRADVKLGVPGRAAASPKESARRAAARAGKTPSGRRTPRGAARAQARGTACRVARRARTAGEARHAPPKHRRAPACGAEGGPHQTSGGPQGRCPEGRPHLPVAARGSWVCRTWSPVCLRAAGETRQSPKGYVSGAPSSSCVAIGSTARVSSNQMYSSNWSGRTAWK
jgi:hypothetical protein